MENRINPVAADCLLKQVRVKGKTSRSLASRIRMLRDHFTAGDGPTLDSHLLKLRSASKRLMLKGRSAGFRKL